MRTGRPAPKASQCCAAFRAGSHPDVLPLGDLNLLGERGPGAARKSASDIGYRGCCHSGLESRPAVRQYRAGDRLRFTRAFNTGGRASKARSDSSAASLGQSHEWVNRRARFAHERVVSSTAAPRATSEALSTLILLAAAAGDAAAKSPTAEASASVRKEVLIAFMMTPMS
jgi:hypothetical protein